MQHKNHSFYFLSFRFQRQVTQTVQSNPAREPGAVLQKNSWHFFTPIFEWTPPPPHQIPTIWQR